MFNKNNAAAPGRIITTPKGLKFKAVRLVCDAGKPQRESRERSRQYQAQWETANAERRREQKRERTRAPAMISDAPAPVSAAPVSAAPTPVPNAPASLARANAQPGDAYEIISGEIQARQRIARERARVTKERERPRKWKKANPDKVRFRELRRGANAYHRPFVSIDCEGANIPGDDIHVPHNMTDELDNPVTQVSGKEIGKDTIYPAHGLFLVGAKGWQRDFTATELSDNPALPLTAGKSTPEYWLGDESKRVLRTADILEFLTSLPEKYGPANGFPNGVNFVSFCFGYDATEIFSGMSRAKVKEITSKRSAETNARTYISGRIRHRLH